MKQTHPMPREANDFGLTLLNQPLVGFMLVSGAACRIPQRCEGLIYPACFAGWFQNVLQWCGLVSEAFMGEDEHSCNRSSSGETSIVGFATTLSGCALPNNFIGTLMGVSCLLTLSRFELRVYGVLWRREDRSQIPVELHYNTSQSQGQTLAVKATLSTLKKPTGPQSSRPGHSRCFPKPPFRVLHTRMPGAPFGKEKPVSSQLRALVP